MAPSPNSDLPSPSTASAINPEKDQARNAQASDGKLPEPGKVG